MTSEIAPLSHLLDELERSGRAETVSMGNVVDAFQHRSLGVLLALFGLTALLPIIGDVPGMAILSATFMLVGIAQSIAGRGRLWLPAFLRRRRLDRDKFEKGIERARPWVARVDHLLKPRLRVLIAGRTQRRAIAAATAFLALTIYPLAFVPFGVNVPALGVLAFGLGLMAGDGLLVLVAYLATTATAFVIISLL